MKHPKIYVGNECKEIVGEHMNISKVEGLIKCLILPPRDLFHPVLPVKAHDRLLFPLCRTCMEDLNVGDCHHESEDDRTFLDTWVADEIRMAISKKYKIVKVYEIWHYEIEQFDKNTKKGGIITEFIHNFSTPTSKK